MMHGVKFATLDTLCTAREMFRPHTFLQVMALISICTTVSNWLQTSGNTARTDGLLQCGAWRSIPANYVCKTHKEPVLPPLTLRGGGDDLEYQRQVNSILASDERRGLKSRRKTQSIKQNVGGSNAEPDAGESATDSDEGRDGHLRPVTRVKEGEVGAGVSRIVSWEEVAERHRQGVSTSREKRRDRPRKDPDSEDLGSGGANKTVAVTVKQLESMSRGMLLKTVRRHALPVQAPGLSNRQIRDAIRPYLPQGSQMGRLERQVKQSKQLARQKGKLHPKSKFGSSRWEDGAEVSVYGPGGPTDSDFVQRATEMVDQEMRDRRIGRTRREREALIDEWAQKLSDLYFTDVLSGKVKPSGEANPGYSLGRNRREGELAEEAEEDTVLGTVGLPDAIAASAPATKAVEAAAAAEEEEGAWAGAEERDFSFLSKQELNDRLLQAARDGSLDAVNALASAGASVHARDGRVGAGWTAVFGAAHGGHAAVVERLLQLGANASAETAHRCTVLHVAVAGRGSPETVEVLAQFGAAVDARNAAGWTPAHTAVVFSRVRALARLAELGADLSLRTVSGLDCAGLALHLGLNHTHRALAQFPARVSAGNMTLRSVTRRRATSPQPPPSELDDDAEELSLQAEAEELVAKAPKEMLWSEDESAGGDPVRDLLKSFPNDPASVAVPMDYD